MAEQRRHFTRDFKVEAVRRTTAEGKSLPEVARELGLGESLLRGWKVALAAEGEQAFPGKGNPTPAEEELHRLRVERDILKKLGRQSRLDRCLVIDSSGRWVSSS